MGDARNQHSKNGHPQVSVRDEDFEPGVVKFVHRDGYGFIAREGKPDVYFHIARVEGSVAGQLAENLPVLVAVGEGKRGPNALMIKIAD